MVCAVSLAEKAMTVGFRPCTSLLQRKNMNQFRIPIGNLGSPIFHRNLNLRSIRQYFRQLRFVNVHTKQSSKQTHQLMLCFLHVLILCFHIRLYEANDETKPFNDPDYSNACNRKFLLKIPLTAGQPWYEHSRQSYGNIFTGT